MNLEDSNAFLDQIFESDSLILAILSSPAKKAISQKITIRPIIIKNELNYQLTEQKQAQALHRNFSKKECLKWLKEAFLDYKQAFYYTKDADYQILISKKQKITLLSKPSSKTDQNLSHNRPKQYLLQEDHPVPFLEQLGVMSHEGKVIAKKRDKFRQINRFLEMIDDVLPHLAGEQRIHIIDFGCGKAYLTFALYHYLKIVKGLNVEIIGLDLKQDVIQFCQDLTEKLGYDRDLRFKLGDINSYHASSKVDMVISLHACDTASDAALEKAIRWQAKVILCVPCCQHELYQQVRSEMLAPILKHGILKERFASLATDALRAQLLEVLGYHTQVIEFIDLEHTPKNLLIRAVKSGKSESQEKHWQAYLKMKEALQVDPSLEKRFLKELPSK